MDPPTRTNAHRNLAAAAAAATATANVTTSHLPKPHKNFQNLVDARIVKTGFDPNTCRSNFLVDSLLRKGQLSEARKLFDGMPNQNTVSTNMLISGYVKSGNLASARELFNSMVDRTAVSWTILIGGYSQKNQFREAFKLFVDMCREGCSDPDYVTFATLLSGCNDPDTANELIQVHANIIKFGYNLILIVCNSLVDSYCKIHRLGLACQVFKDMPARDSVSFNALITGYAKEGLNEEAIKLFVEMQHSGFKPSDFTFASALSAGIGLDDIALGKQVHAFVVKTNFVGNVFVANALLDFYSKHDHAVEARSLFGEMPEVDGVSYNVMITCYAWNEQHKESLKLFMELQCTRFDRSQFPYSTLLSIVANTLNLHIGEQIHTQTIVTTAFSEVKVANSLVDMYAKCGKFVEAKKIFANLRHRNTIPWTAMISGYVQKGNLEEGLNLFLEMRRANVSVDQATFASILRASAELASISLGKQLHSFVIRSGFMSNVFSGSALLDMYAKCGSLNEAIQTFQEMPERNIVSWNSLISAFAQNGDAEATHKSFEDMVRSGHQPDLVSFLSVLSFCSHCGLVEEGLRYFNSMSQKYKLKPNKEHYVSMVDILCRSGRFDEAEKLMAQMPFEPDEVMWSSVINSCRIHKNLELAKKAADQLFKMEKLRDAAPYVAMSNIYAVAGQWESVSHVKKALRERGVKKVTAYSWVELKRKVHVFTANDNLHPQTKEIRREIVNLMQQMKNEGYKPDTSSALHDVDEEINL